MEQNLEKYPLPPGFKRVKELGKGNDAIVLLCQYYGEDVKIKAYCDKQGYLAVKIAHPDKQLDSNEAAISKNLIEHLIHHPEDSTKLNPDFAVEDKNGNAVCLISRFISFSQTSGEPISSDLNSFITENTHYISGQATTNKLEAALHNDLSIMLSQLANSMHTSQAALHNASTTLHRNTSTQNYLIRTPQTDEAGNVIRLSATIINYSRSTQLGENESAPLHPKEASHRYMSTAVYRTQTTTVASDLFSLKCAIIEMAALALGAKNVNEALSLSRANTIDKFLKTRFKSFYDDNLTLLKYLKNVTDLIDTCKDAHKQTEMKIFVECYRKFLTTMPSEDKSNHEIQTDQRHQLLIANESFIQKCFNEKRNSNGKTQLNPEQLKLLASRLCAIDVSERFKKSPEYKVIQKMAGIAETKSLAQRAAERLASRPDPSVIVQSPEESSTRPFKP